MGGDVRVLVADDQEIVRTGLTMILNAQPGIEVVGEAPDGRRAVELAKRLRPDVCLFDIRMPGIDGIEATRRIVTGHPDTVVFLLSTYRADDLPAEARSCGAADYIHKEDFGSAVLRDLWDRHAPAA